MVATTSADSHSQKQYQDMSAIERECVEDVFFTVRDLYTGKRSLRQVKHEEISKVAFVLGQLATQVSAGYFYKLVTYVRCPPNYSNITYSYLKGWK